MVDPSRISSFLQRTSSALKKALEDGDSEGALRYEKMLDRAAPLGEQAIAQQEQMRQAPAPQVPQEQASSPDYVIPFNKTKQQAKPPVTTRAFWDATGSGSPDLDRAVAAKDAKSQVQQKPQGGQVVPQPPVGGNSEFDQILRSLQVASLPQTVTPAKTRAHDLLIAARERSINGEGEGLKVEQPRDARSDEIAPLLKFMSGQPKSALEKSKAEPSNPVVMDEANSGQAEEAKAGFVAPEQGEEDAVAKIRRMVGEKPSAFTFENIMMLLLFGAPRTFAKIQADNANWHQMVKDLIFNEEKTRKEDKRHKESVGFRELEVAANEKRAQTDSDKAKAGVQGADLRSMVSAAKGIINATNADPGSQEYKDAVRFLSAVRPQMPSDGVPSVPK